MTSAAETLVSEFYDDIKARMGGHPLTVGQYARLLMRHQRLAPYLANCLQYYMVSLDQTRGGRNPSYKQMSSVSTAKFQSFKRFVKELEAHSADLATFYATLGHARVAFFHHYLVDWHAIAGQLPEAHRHFAPRLDNLALKRRRNPRDGAPWAVGR